MTEAQRLTPTEIAAIQAAVAIAFEGKPKPKGSQSDFIHEQAKVAIAKLSNRGNQ